MNIFENCLISNLIHGTIANLVLSDRLSRRICLPIRFVQSTSHCISMETFVYWLSRSLLLTNILHPRDYVQRDCLAVGVLIKNATVEFLFSRACAHQRERIREDEKENEKERNLQATRLKQISSVKLKIRLKYWKRSSVEERWVFSFPRFSNPLFYDFIRLNSGGESSAWKNRKVSSCVRRGNSTSR